MILPAIGAAIWCIMGVLSLGACVLAGRCETRAAGILNACAPAEPAERLAG